MTVTIKDKDLFLINRDKLSYKMTGKEFKQEFGTIYLEDNSPPTINSVVITEVDDDSSYRFEDQSFQVNTTMAVGGLPSPQFGLKARVGGVLFSAPTISNNIVSVNGAELTFSGPKDLTDLDSESVWMTDGTVDSVTNIFNKSDYKLVTSTIASVGGYGEGKSTFVDTIINGDNARIYSFITPTTLRSLECNPDGSGLYGRILSVSLNGNKILLDASTSGVITGIPFNTNLTWDVTFADTKGNESWGAQNKNNSSAYKIVFNTPFQIDEIVILNTDSHNASNVLVNGDLLDDDNAKTLTFNSPNPDLQYFEVGDVVQVDRTFFAPTTTVEDQLNAFTVNTSYAIFITNTGDTTVNWRPRTPISGSQVVVRTRCGTSGGTGSAAVVQVGSQVSANVVNTAMISVTLSIDGGTLDEISFKATGFVDPQGFLIESIIVDGVQLIGDQYIDGGFKITGLSDNTMNVDGGDWNVDDIIEYQTNGGIGDVTSVNTSTNTMNVTNSGDRDNRFIGVNKSGIDFFVTDGNLSVSGSSEMFCKMTYNGVYDRMEVTDLLENEVGFQNTIVKDPVIYFPPTLNGTATDSYLSEGAHIIATVEAKNVVGSDEKESNLLIPEPVVDGISDIITLANGDEETVELEVLSTSGLNSFTLGEQVVMADEDRNILDYTLTTSQITKVVSGLNSFIDSTTNDGTAARLYTLNPPVLVKNISVNDKGDGLYGRVLYLSLNGVKYENVGGLPSGIPYNNDLTWDNTFDSSTKEEFGAQNPIGKSYEYNILSGILVDQLMVLNSSSHNASNVLINGQKLDSTEGKTLTFASPNPDLKYFNAGDIVQANPILKGITSLDVVLPSGFSNNGYIGAVVINGLMLCDWSTFPANKNEYTQFDCGDCNSVGASSGPKEWADGVLYDVVNKTNQTKFRPVPGSPPTMSISWTNPIDIKTLTMYISQGSADDLTSSMQSGGVELGTLFMPYRPGVPEFDVGEAVLKVSTVTSIDVSNNKMSVSEGDWYAASPGDGSGVVGGDTEVTSGPVTGEGNITSISGTTVTISNSNGRWIDWDNNNEGAEYTSDHSPKQFRIGKKSAFFLEAGKSEHIDLFNTIESNLTQFSTDAASYRLANPEPRFWDNIDKEILTQTEVINKYGIDDCDNDRVFCFKNDYSEFTVNGAVREGNDFYATYDFNTELKEIRTKLDELEGN